VRNVKDDRDREWEEQYRQREIDIRLHQLEADLERENAPVQATTKENSDRQPARTFTRDLRLAAKLSGFFVGSIVVVFTASMLASMSFFIFIAAAGWACYELGRKSS
jgi:F0F1-type ATP synthase assembly protein I